jgi:hypothetical protein
MGRVFSVRSLAAAQLAQAFPLMHAVEPALTPESWRDYGEALAAPDQPARGGVLAAFGEDGYIYGLCCYAWRPDPCADTRILAVEQFVVLDLVDHPGAVDALLGGIDRLAERHQARHIDIAIPARQALVTSRDGAPAEAFRKAGYVAEGIKLCKRLDGAPAASRG